MDKRSVPYYVILLIAVFIGSISQVMLKKSSMRKYSSPLLEYLNPLVIFAYILFVWTTLLSTLAYRVVPLSMGPIMEATNYCYVTFFGVTIFHEKINSRKIFALGFIIAGILTYSLFG